MVIVLLKKKWYYVNKDIFNEKPKVVIFSFDDVNFDDKTLIEDKDFIGFWNFFKFLSSRENVSYLTKIQVINALQGG